MIVVGYSADVFGQAAIEHAIAEAKLRNTSLLVINATSGESYVDARFARSGELQDVEEHLGESGVAFELRQEVGVDVAEALLDAAAPPSLRALDTYFLHHAVLGPLLGVADSAVSYVHSQAEAEEAVEKGSCRLAVLLRSTPVQQIVDVAEAGESMPAKSTFFHPKLPSALVIHPLAV